MGIPAAACGEPLVVPRGLGNHLATHKDQHGRKAVVEKTEEIHHASEQEVEGSQTENGKDVGRENHKGEVRSALGYHAKDGRHAVDGKEDVCALHHQQHEKQGSGNQAALLADKKAVTRWLHREGHGAASQLEQEVVFRMNIVVRDGEFYARVDQEAAEDPEDPLEVGDQFGPHQHKGQPHQHGAEDAPEEHPILVFQRHAKGAEDDRKHEDVVHRERPFDEIAGEKLDGRVAAEPPPDDAVEAECQQRPEGCPETAFSQRWLVGLSVKNRQVKREHHDHEGGEGQPVTGMNHSGGVDGCGSRNSRRSEKAREHGRFRGRGGQGKLEEATGTDRPFRSFYSNESISADRRREDIRRSRPLIRWPTGLDLHPLARYRPQPAEAFARMCVPGGFRPFIAAFSMNMFGSPAVASRPVSTYLTDAAIPVAIFVAMVAVVMPLPPAVVDLLLAANLTVAVIALLAAIAARTPLEMAVFPTFLLGATLVRLVLNIATTRLILTRAAVDGEAAAGHVVEAFGGFVSGNSLAVGAVIFALIAIVQLVVITAGSSRTSEVAARFTLDAMPGRQMAIDAELKAGTVTAAEARRLRHELQSRSDFFSSMDGASRFVRGEAIAGVVITLINLAGGIAIGTLQHGMPIARAGEVFSQLTIGDGLVTAASSLLISVAMGLLISRSSHAADLSRELGRQFGGKPQVLATAAVFLAALSLTGLPFLPLISVAAVLGVIAWRQRHSAPPQSAAPAAEEAPPERLVAQLLGEEAVTVELGRDLLYLVAGPSPVLPSRTTALRGSLAADLGIVLPKVVFRDSMESPPRWCQIQVAGEVLYEATLPAGRVLAVGGELLARDDEHATVDPLSHARSRWIAAREVADARQRGSDLHDAADVVMRALEGSVRRRAELLLTRDAVARLVESVRQSQPAVVDGVVPEILPLKLVHRTLQQLVREGVPIRPLPVVLEIMADHADDTNEPEQLAEWVRRGLARTICRRARDPSGRLTTIRLSDVAIARLSHQPSGSPTADNDERRLVTEIRRAVRPGLQRGSPPVVVVPANLRRRLRGLLAVDLPDVPVLAAEEIVNEGGVEVFATVGGIAEPAASAA